MSENLVESNAELQNALLAAFGADALQWFDEDEFDPQALHEQSALVNDDIHVGIDLQTALFQLTQQGPEGYTSTLADDDESQQNESENTARYVVFEVGKLRYGIPLDGVKEIDRCGKITALPRTPEWLRGITNLRGTIFSVTDFRKLLKLEVESLFSIEKMIVIHSKRYGTSTALVVDRVLGIRNLEAIPDSADTITGPVAAFASGISALHSDSVVLIQPDLLLGCSDLQSISDS